MKIASTIEVRTNSTRLSRKALLTILGKPMLQLHLERIKRAKKIDEIVVATTTNSNDDEIEKIANYMNVKCFRGSEEDVLQRVLDAAKLVKADAIVEIWGDAPLMDPQILDNLVDFYLKNDYDAVGTMLPNFPYTYPIGLSCLIFSTKILEDVEKITKNPTDRENVSNYIYEHTEKYKVAPLPCPPELNFPSLRFEVDEMKDFEVVKKIFEEFYPRNPLFTAYDVVNFLNTHLEIRDHNKSVVKRRLPEWDVLFQKKN